MVKAIHDTIFMDTIEDTIDNLSTVSYVLLQTTQLKDVPKAAITMIRAIACTIDNLQNKLKEWDNAMELTMDTPWIVLQQHISTIKSKLGALITVIELQHQSIKVMQTQHKDQRTNLDVIRQASTGQNQQKNHFQATQLRLPQSHVTVICLLRIRDL